MFLQCNFEVGGLDSLRIELLLLCATIVTCPIAYAQENDERPSENIDEIVSEMVEPELPDEIEEITVYGDRPIHALRREVYRAEQNFFDVFSSLNEDDEYDVRCFYKIPSFTHIRRHVCRAKFVSDATSAESAPWFSEQVGAFNRPASIVI